MVATGTETWVLRHLGWPWIRDVVLPKIAKASMKLSGVEFSPNRLDLQSLDKLLSTANRVDAIVVIGRTLHEHELDNIRKFKRVIFPHPESESISHYAETVNERGHLKRYIAEATNSLLDDGIDVKWYPHAIHHSILLVDADRTSGWVQVESVLPFSIPNLRPRWRVNRNRQEQLVLSIRDVFDKMWDASSKPSKAVIKQLTPGGAR